MADADKESIVKRLEELGVSRVRELMSHGGLPTHWGAVVNDWLVEQTQAKARDDEDNPSKH